MASPQTRHLTAGHIVKTWDRGLPLDPRTLHFIQSTFGLSRIEEIIAVLGDPGHDDRDLLMRVICLPGENIQVELEPIVEEEIFTETEIGKLSADLLSGAPVIRLMLPGGKKGMGFNALYGDIWDFVSRRCFPGFHGRKKAADRGARSIPAVYASPRKVQHGDPYAFGDSGALHGRGKRLEGHRVN
jgi:hypothetical protein